MESKQASGGRARAEKLSPERRSEIASLGAKTRWRKKNEETKQRIYVVGCANGPMKIGIAQCVKKRRTDLQVGSPEILEIFADISVGEHQAKNIERAVHYALRATHVRGEWFDVSSDRAIAEVHKQIESMVLPPERNKPLGRREPFQIRMDLELMDRLARVAASMQMSKTEIVEAGINMRLDMLEGYVAMDKGPPKTVKAAARGQGKSLAVKAVVAAKKKAPAVCKGGPIHRKPIGWDASGEPIYRGK